MIKSKSLYNIVIEDCQFNILLRYNLNTTHITIGTTFQDKRKYYKDNKDRIKKVNKIYRENNKDKRNQYYENNRDSNTLRIKSEEYKIMLSCRFQGIPIDNFNGFISNQPYCKLWTESFREKIRDQFHNKCYLCNATKKDNLNRELSVHHVNYNKSCLCNSTCEFVPLCMKCHGKTGSKRQFYEDLIMNYLYPNRYFMIEI